MPIHLKGELVDPLINAIAHLKSLLQKRSAEIPAMRVAEQNRN